MSNTHLPGNAVLSRAFEREMKELYGDAKPAWLGNGPVFSDVGLHRLLSDLGCATTQFVSHRKVSGSEHVE